MNDAVRVGECHCFTKSAEETKEVGAAAILASVLIEPRPAHELHRVVDAPVREFETRDRLRLVPHAIHGVSVRHFVREDLQRDRAIQLTVLCFVDDSHSSARDLANDRVSRAAEVGSVSDVAEMRNRRLRQRPHGSTPRSARASARNSCSLAVASRSVSSTICRN